MKKQEEKRVVQKVAITPPDFRTAILEIVGTSPLVQHKFSQKAREQMREKQEAGGTAQKGKAREAKDFKSCFEAATYRIGNKSGPYGIPATAIRASMISACRLVGFKMTVGKLAFWIEADGNDYQDGTPLVKINAKPPTMDVRPARNDNGSVDLRARPMWAPGWTASVRVGYDAGQFTAEDVANLLQRAGLQCGILEGRNNSPSSCGLGWGAFTIKMKKGGGK